MSPRSRKALAALALTLLLPAGYAAGVQQAHNFHPIIAGEAYRSAQPDAADLTRWAAEQGIRSVVNLRGADPGAGWYEEEIAAARSLGLSHADFAMSAGQDLSQPRAEELLALLERMPKPVLIHCRSGADRTGLASALYLAARGEGEARAESQISFRYGHVSLPFAGAWAMDRSWEALEGWLGYAS